MIDATDCYIQAVMSVVRHFRCFFILNATKKAKDCGGHMIPSPLHMSDIRCIFRTGVAMITYEL